MFKFWSNYCEAVRFTCEAQAVVSTRLLLLASGDLAAVDEASRMITEKVVAFAGAQAAAEQALAEGRGLYEAAELAYVPVRDLVHDNSCRLLSAAH